MYARLLFVAGLVGLVAAGSARAAPFVPADDALVLERLPGRGTAQFRELKLLKVAAAGAPSDLGAATRLATAYVRTSRIESDPRFLGYAQAALRLWWNDPAAPTEVLVLRATIRQSRHEFDAALADLDRVVQRDPRQAQALLTRATVLTVQGKYDAARADCRRLSGLVADVYAVACAAAIDSVTGKAALAYTTLQQALAAAPRSDATQRVWAETLLGEIAHRRGDAAAERHFRAALEADSKDLYLLGAYADWLLDRGRPEEAIALLRNETRADPLLLRLALAQRAVGRAEAAASVATLAARFEASQRRGDTAHLREHARFALHLSGSGTQALALARDNWKDQREPSDLRILAEAALATGDAAALATVRQWLAETGFDWSALRARVDAQGATR